MVLKILFAPLWISNVAGTQKRWSTVENEGSRSPVEVYLQTLWRSKLLEDRDEWEVVETMHTLLLKEGTLYIVELFRGNDRERPLRTLPDAWISRWCADQRLIVIMWSLILRGMFYVWYWAFCMEVQFGWTLA